MLYAATRAQMPNLQLRNFGCGGETTTSLIEGGFPFDFPCGYGHATSQLEEALAFLRAHSGEIAFVTIDIGANDLLTGAGLPVIAANLALILAGVRDAAGPAVPIVGMNYYDPFVAPVWFATHDVGLVAAEAANIAAFNDFLEGSYAAAGVTVADVEAAFQLQSLTLVDGIPLNVVRACEWTWMCAVGDIHANDDGYTVIAQTFAAALP